jgi:pimeloyl-ACP methyl ester carboxylesterase
VDAIAATSVQIPEQFLGAARSLLDVFIAGAGHYNAEPRFGLETAIGRIQNLPVSLRRKPTLSTTGSMRETMSASPKKFATSSGMAGGIAVAVLASAATALWVEHMARRAERDNPPAGRFISVDGVRLHYIERGQGSPVILLHGNTVPLQDFIGSEIVEWLARRHRVIAFDRPGFGYSERPRDRFWTGQAQATLLQKALEQLDVQRPVAVGHSWGTLVALAMAVSSPENLRGLVLISGYYYPVARMDAVMSAPVALPLLGDALRYTVSPLTGRLLLKRAVKAMFSPADVPHDFFDVVSREMMLRPLQIRATAEDAALMVPSAAHLRDHYSRLRMPVSIFAGKDDKVVDAESHSVRLHSEVQHSTINVAPAAGHMVHYAMVDEIVNAIEAMSVTDDALEVRAPGAIPLSDDALNVADGSLSLKTP